MAAGLADENQALAEQYNAQVRRGGSTAWGDMSGAQLTQVERLAAEQYNAEVAGGGRGARICARGTSGGPAAPPAATSH